MASFLSKAIFIYTCFTCIKFYSVLKLFAGFANAAFMVPSSARGQGVGRCMAEHCLSEARRLGFRAMQFNFVVATNQSAIHLWQQLGFKIVGTLPGAFRHPERGHVDVYVMFRALG